MKKVLILICISLISLSCTSEDNPLVNNGEIRIVFPISSNQQGTVYFSTDWSTSSICPEHFFIKNFDITKYNATSLTIKFITEIRNSRDVRYEHRPYYIGNSHFDFYNVTDSSRIDGTLFTVDSLVVINSPSSSLYKYKTFETANIINSFPQKPINIGFRQVRDGDTTAIVAYITWAELVIE